MMSIYTKVEDLTTLQFHHIMTATDYNLLPDGAILLHIPSPQGYAYWHNDDKDFIKNAELLLLKNSVKKIEEWKPSHFINLKKDTSCSNH